jgi:hypothetical protein
MEIINFGELTFDEEELKKRLRFDRLKSKRSEINFLIKESQKWIEPKAVYTFLDITKIDADKIELVNEFNLKSIYLGDKFRVGQTIAPFVLTLGSKFDVELSKMMSKGLSLSWILDQIGNYAIRVSRIKLKELVEEYLGSGVSTFLPGTGKTELFGLDQQLVLFDILQPQKNIDVRLTPSYLMIPQKSISGIFSVLSCVRDS